MEIGRVNEKRKEPEKLPVNEEMDILAPIDDVNQIRLFRFMGATEFYCGYIPCDWFEKYNKNMKNWSKKDLQLSLNRREIGFANLVSLEDFVRVVKEAHECGAKLYVTINAPSYPEINYPFLTEYVKLLDDCQTDGLIVTDPGLLQRIHKSVKSRLILSTCNQAASADAVRFVQQLGVQRIVFPRYISLRQMERITDLVPDMEYECFILEGKCVYDDGNCNILHSCGSFCSERWYSRYYDSGLGPVQQPQLYENEEDFYEFTSPYLNTRLSDSGWRNMGCGICSLEYIVKNIKIDSLKLAGRGLDNRQKLKNISILKKALDLAYKGASARELKKFMEKYQPWKEICNNRYRCYFPDFDEQESYRL